MMSNTEKLIERAAQGDSLAVDLLMDRHRQRLRKMIAVRIDSRLNVRVDPSDIVQDALADAAARLPQYLRERPIAFYPWLRQIAWNRLMDAYRKHKLRGKRNVNRERTVDFQLSDEWTASLIGKLVDDATSPSDRLIREELHQRVRDELARLEVKDREVLVMRHLEQMSVQEIAESLGISEGAVKMRRLRAVRRLADLLESN